MGERNEQGTLKLNEHPQTELIGRVVYWFCGLVGGAACISLLSAECYRNKYEKAKDRAEFESREVMQSLIDLYDTNKDRIFDVGEKRRLLDEVGFKEKIDSGTSIMAYTPGFLRSTEPWSSDYLHKLSQEHGAFTGPFNTIYIPIDEAEVGA